MHKTKNMAQGMGRAVADVLKRIFSVSKARNKGWVQKEGEMIRRVLTKRMKISRNRE